MSAVVAGVTEKLQDLLPGQIGPNKRWSTTAVERYILLADNAVRERTENRNLLQEITLIAGTAEYALDSEFIQITKVQFNDGDDYYDLTPVTFDDLDRISKDWRSDTGTRPEYYTLVGCPGTPGAKIHIWRPIVAGSAEDLFVYGKSIGSGAADTVPDDVQRKAHVPYVMSILMAQQDPRAAARWYGEFLAGCDYVSARTRSPYAAGISNVKVGF